MLQTELCARRNFSFWGKRKKKKTARKTCWFLWCQSFSFWGLDFISAEVGFTTDFKSPVFLLL